MILYAYIFWHVDQKIFNDVDPKKPCKSWVLHGCLTKTTRWLSPLSVPLPESKEILFELQWLGQDRPADWLPEVSICPLQLQSFCPAPDFLLSRRSIHITHRRTTPAASTGAVFVKRPATYPLLCFNVRELIRKLWPYMPCTSDQMWIKHSATNASHVLIPLRHRIRLPRLCSCGETGSPHGTVPWCGEVGGVLMGVWHLWPPGSGRFVWK